MIASTDNKIIVGGQIENKIDFQRCESMGVKPYYLDVSNDGNYSMVEITEKLPISKQFITVFLLNPNQLDEINKVIDGVNSITSLYLQKIELFKEYIPSILVDKIIK